MSAVLNFVSFVLFGIFLAVSVFLFAAFNKIQSSEYMDEVFHVHQVQSYCRGNFSQWDSKITTLPGLYLISIGALLPISDVIKADLCNVFNLRIISFLFNIINVYLIYNILTWLHRNTETYKLRITSITLACLPVLYFSSMLYYTDSCALFCVLLMYLLHLYGNDYLAGLTGLVSVFVRQTNIAWVFLVAVERVVQECEHHSHQHVGQSLESLLKFFKTLLLMPIRKSRAFASLCFDIISSTFMYIVVGILFTLFVVKNEGIVLGDKMAHEACFNMPQLGYFMMFCLISALPHLISIHQVKHSLLALRKNIFTSLIVFSIAILSIRYCTVVHPYTLADNRHITFYVWNKIYGRHDTVKYLLAPLYIYVGYNMVLLFQSKNAISKLVIMMCVAVVVIPAKLLEFRYFIIPYVLLRMQFRSSCIRKIFAELLISISLNAFVFYMFTFRPFKWPDSVEIQRFMW